MVFSLFFVQQSSFKNFRLFVCQSEHSSMKKRQHVWRKGESDSAELLAKTKTDVCQKENLRS